MSTMILSGPSENKDKEKRPKRRPDCMKRDDYAKTGGEEFLPRCIAFFNRIPKESLIIPNSHATHIGTTFLAAIFSVIVFGTTKDHG